MYPIINPRVGQRVTSPRLNTEGGTITRVLGRGTIPQVMVLWDGWQSAMAVYINEIGAIIPGNEDGYFDGPPGYVDAG